MFNALSRLVCIFASLFWNTVSSVWTAAGFSFLFHHFCPPSQPILPEQLHGHRKSGGGGFREDQSGRSWLIWKDPDAGKDWGQEEKGTTEDETAGWHHRLDGHGFGWTPGVGDGQGGLACCSSRGRKEQTWLSDWTELNWTENGRRKGKTEIPNFPLYFLKESSWLLRLGQCSVTRLCPALCTPMVSHAEPARLLCPWNFPDKNTGADCHFLLWAD